MNLYRSLYPTMCEQIGFLLILYLRRLVNKISLHIGFSLFLDVGVARSES